MAVESRKIGDVSILGFQGRLTRGAGDLAMREHFVSLLDAAVKAGMASRPRPGPSRSGFYG